MRSWVAVTIIVVALPLGCGELNPAYCRAHPDDVDCPRIDAGTDAPIVACDSPDDCVAPTPVCELTEQICVQCTANTDCTGNKPICDPDPNVCRPCTAHTECPSALCLPDGSCADTADVTYVVGGAQPSTTCTQVLPCPNFPAAFVPAARKYFKVSGAVLDSAVALFDNRPATIFAEPGSSISRTGAGDVIEIKGTSNVAIHGLTIRNATSGANDDGLYIHEAATVVLTNVKIHGNSGNGLLFAGTALANVTVVDSLIYQNLGTGVSVTGAGKLTVTDSILYANDGIGISATTSGLVTIGSSVIAFNDAGGLSVAADYAVTNSIISRNGSTSSLLGGVQLSTANAAAVFQFNTVSGNVSATTIGGGMSGIICNAAVSVTNSILTGDIGVVCAVSYSLTTAATTGVGNKIGSPMFIDVGIDPLVAGFYRIMTTSPAKDSANPAASITVDIDGEPRPAGLADMGADETP